MAAGSCCPSPLAAQAPVWILWAVRCPRREAAFLGRGLKERAPTTGPSGRPPSTSRSCCCAWRRRTRDWRVSCICAAHARNDNCPPPQDESKPRSHEGQICPKNIRGTYCFSADTGNVYEASRGCSCQPGDGTGGSAFSCRRPSACFESFKCCHHGWRLWGSGYI